MCISECVYTYIHVPRHTYIHFLRNVITYTYYIICIGMYVCMSACMYVCKVGFVVFVLVALWLESHAERCGGGGFPQLALGGLSAVIYAHSGCAQNVVSLLRVSH